MVNVDEDTVDCFAMRAPAPTRGNHQAKNNQHFENRQRTAAAAAAGMVNRHATNHFDSTSSSSSTSSMELTSTSQAVAACSPVPQTATTVVNADEDTMADQQSSQAAAMGCDEESMMSQTATSEVKKERKRKQRRSSMNICNNLSTLHITSASQLFVYNWPDDSDGEPSDERERDRLMRVYTSNYNEIFCLQEQISEYLGVKSFKRKYPG